MMTLRLDLPTTEWMESSASLSNQLSSKSIFETSLTPFYSVISIVATISFSAAMKTAVKNHQEVIFFQKDLLIYAEFSVRVIIFYLCSKAVACSL